MCWAIRDWLTSAIGSRWFEQSLIAAFPLLIEACISGKPADSKPFHIGLSPFLEVDNLPIWIRTYILKIELAALIMI